MSRWSDRTAFHPDLRLASLAVPRHLVGPRSLPVLRRLAGLARGARGVEVARVGAVTCRLHRPPAGTPTPAPALLWIHGGGYVLGSPAQDDALCGRIAADLGVLVAAVAYRHAPEHPFPTPLHDCHDALAWLAARDDIDATRVAVGGASAGGGLAAALAVLARDRGEVPVAFQLLSYPMLDERTAGDDRYLRLWDSRSNRFGWASYAGPGPARHDDLGGLPPAWIGVGTLDLFHDEDLAYAERLRAAGVPCDVEAVDGAFHGFDSVAPKAGVTEAFRRSQLAALRANL